MKIEKVHRTEAALLTALTLRSKNYWDYGDEQIELWREELTITPEYIDHNQVYKLSIEEKIIGFYAFRSESDQEVKLNFLFVEPEYVGKGYGKLLLSDFLERLRKIPTVEKVFLDADPNAKPFYEKMGFKVVGRLKSAIPNRFLPIMEMKIT